MLSGCSLLPREWADWLMGEEVRDEETFYFYDAPPPGTEANAFPQQPEDPDWTQGVPQPRDGKTPETAKRAIFKGDPEKRLATVEGQLTKMGNEVQALRAEMNDVIPALRQLIEERNAAMAAQTVGTGQMQPSQSPQPAMRDNAGFATRQPSYPRPVTADSRQMAYSANVRNIRFGDYPNKTRIVLDLSESAGYTYDIDNRQGVLSVMLPDAGWQGPSRGTLNKSELFSGYTVQEVPGQGSRLTLQLRKPARVLFADQLQPNSTYPSHRVFLDVAPM